MHGYRHPHHEDPVARAEKLERRFQDLLREKQEQDEQLAELYEAAGVDPSAPVDEDLIETLPEGLRALFEVDETARPPAASSQPTPPLSGFVMRG